MSIASVGWGANPNMKKTMCFILTMKYIECDNNELGTTNNRLALIRWFGPLGLSPQPTRA